jgi:hypothetical protein
VGNVTRVSITVGPAVSITPDTNAVGPQGVVNFSASGGSGSG